MKNKRKSKKNVFVNGKNKSGRNLKPHKNIDKSAGKSAKSGKSRLKKNDSNRRNEEFNDKLVVKGRHECLQVLNSNIRVLQIYVSESVKPDFYSALLSAVDKRQIPMSALKPELFKQKFGINSQGVAAICPPFEYCTLDELIKNDNSGVLVALNKVEDPRNLGAIVRTVEASGCGGVIIPKHRSAKMTEWAIRTAQGASSFLPVAMVTNLTDAVNKLKESGYYAVGLDGGGEKKYSQLSYSEKKVVLVAGGEDAGLGTRLYKACDNIVKIPLNGRTPSLNVSISVAVALYEILRQKDFLKK